MSLGSEVTNSLTEQHRIVLEERAKEGKGVGRSSAVRRPAIAVFKGTSRRGPSQHPPWGPAGSTEGKSLGNEWSSPPSGESLEACVLQLLWVKEESMKRVPSHWKEAVNTKQIQCSISNNAFFWITHPGGSLKMSSMPRHTAVCTTGTHQPQPLHSVLQKGQ